MMADQKLPCGLILLASIVWHCGTDLGHTQQPAHPEAAPEKSAGLVYKSATLIYEVSPKVKDVDIDLKKLVEVLDTRLKPTQFTLPSLKVSAEGTRQVKITVGKCTAEQMMEIKKLVTTIGTLEFRQLANQKDHAELIDEAREVAENELRIEGKAVARWVAVRLNQVIFVSELEEIFLSLIERARRTKDDEVFLNGRTVAYWLTLDVDKIPLEQRQGVATRKLAGGETQVLVLPNSGVSFGGYVFRNSKNKEVQTLVIVDEFNITGAELGRTMTMLDNSDKLAAGFSFREEGKQRFAKFTNEIAPDERGYARRMGMVLDDTLISAPLVLEPITGGHGMILGDFTEEEVNFIVAVLHAGPLPVPLGRQPVREILVK